MSSTNPYNLGDEIPGSGLTIISTLGTGGMGTVFLTYDAALEQHRTVKLLNATVAPEKLQAEARTLARLKHPNIVRVLRFGITTDEKALAYFVMEEAHGQSLKKVLEDAKRSWTKGESLLGLTEALDIGVELFDGLAFAHEQNVIHRDLKPDNVIIHKEGGVITTKLIDFGLSTQVHNGSVLGTPMYASPEAIRGDVVTNRTDLYSAGQTLYEIIAGQAPFEDASDSMGSLLKAHKNTIPKLLSEHVQVPEELSQLVAKLLEKDPAMRPRSAREVAATLRAIRASFHERHSLPDVRFITDPGRAHAALDHSIANTPHDGNTKPITILEEKQTVDLAAKRTLDLRAPTEVDVEFAWLEEIRKEERSKLSRATTRTLEPITFAFVDKVYLDEEAARSLADETFYAKRDAEKAELRKRRRTSAIMAMMLMMGFSVLLVAFAIGR